MVDICSVLIDVANCTLDGKRTFTPHLCMATAPEVNKCQVVKVRPCFDLLNHFIINVVVIIKQQTSYIGLKQMC